MSRKYLLISFGMETSAHMKRLERLLVYQGADVETVTTTELASKASMSFFGLPIDFRQSRVGLQKIFRTGLEQLVKLVVLVIAGSHVLRTLRGATSSYQNLGRVTSSFQTPRILVWFCRVFPSLRLPVALRLFPELPEMRRLHDSQVVVVTPEDSILNNGLVLHAAIRDAGWKHAVFNYTHSVRTEWKNHYYRKGLQPLTGLVLRATLPENMKTLHHKRVLPLPPVALLQVQLSGLVPANPWSGYCGFADLYLRDNVYDEETLQEEGLPDCAIEPIEVSLSKQGFGGQQSSGEESTTMVFFLPPDQIPGLGLLEELFGALRLCVQSLRADFPQLEFWACPHPRLGLLAGEISQRVGIAAECIGPAERFVLSMDCAIFFGSAMTKIAEYRGIPHVNFDFFQLGNLVVPEIPGFSANVDSVDELEKTLRKFAPWRPRRPLQVLPTAAEALESL